MANKSTSTFTGQSDNTTKDNVAWYHWGFYTQLEDRSTIVSFTLECHRDWAPTSFDRFVHLIDNQFLQDQFLVRAIPSFVLDFNYGPIGGQHDKKEQWQAYQQLEWFAPNIDEPKHGATQQSNTRGTITFGQEEDGRTKTEVFVNTQDNLRLDKLGFWPFGTIVKTEIKTTISSNGTNNTTTQTFHTTDQNWAKAVEDAVCMKYGDIFFADGADEKKAKVRQSLLIAGGNDYIARHYPGMSQLTHVQRLTTRPTTS